jgi:hypothetical protein
MFMGNHNSVYTLYLQAQFSQPALHFFNGKAAVDQYGGVLMLYHQRISSAAAA